MTEPRLPRERYRVLGLLGTGGMASVWRVLDVRLNVERAVKVLPQGVLREAQLAAGLSHPHIVTVHDVLDAPEGACVVMELAQGSVADHVATHGPLAMRLAATIVADIAEALAVAHAAGIVHRDVKPQNLLVFAGGRVKLGDFGIAALLDGDAPAESTQAILGSVPFMAPEQRRGHALPASDVYATAVSLAWMLTGELPGDLYVDTVRDALRKRLGADAAPLVDVLAAAGAHAPEARPTAGELATAMRAFGGDGNARLGDIARATPPAPPSGRWVRVGEGGLGDRRGSSRRAAWGLAAGALLVGGGAGVWAGVQDAVRGRWVEEPESVRLARELEAIPVCADAPKRWELQHQPRNARSTPGGREAGAGRFVDVDADGHADVVFGHLLEEQFRVFWGDGRELKDDTTSVSAGRLAMGAPGTVDAGDVDGDGHVDLVGVAPEQMGIVIAHGRGGRAFDAGERVETGQVPQRVRIVDWNDDGRADVLLSLLLGTRFNLVWRASGDNGLEPVRDLYDHADSFDIRGVGGLERRLDVLTDGVYRRMRRTTDGALSAPEYEVAIPLHGADTLATSDDGKHVYVWHSSNPSADAVRVDPQHKSMCRLILPTYGNIQDLGDFNGDNRIDAVGLTTCSYCTSQYRVWLGRA